MSCSLIPASSATSCCLLPITLYGRARTLAHSPQLFHADLGRVSSNLPVVLLRVPAQLQHVTQNCDRPSPPLRRQTQQTVQRRSHCHRVGVIGVIHDADTRQRQDLTPAPSKPKPGQAFRTLLHRKTGCIARTGRSHDVLCPVSRHGRSLNPNLTLGPAQHHLACHPTLGAQQPPLHLRVAYIRANTEVDYPTAQLSQIWLQNITFCRNDRTAGRG